jgi:ABC-type transport system involved in multi-copper enzyme maturation permease subunit
MMALSMRAVYTVAKKEFADNVRNKWVLALIIVFVILTVAASFLAGGQTEPLKLSYQELSQSMMQDDEGTDIDFPPDESLDIPEMDPGDAIMISDRVEHIASRFESIFNKTVTYVWFNSSHEGENTSDWYNVSIDFYENFDVIIEGDQTDDYIVGDIMVITLHVTELEFEVDQKVIKVEFIKELWDSENNTFRFILPASVLEEEEDDVLLGGMEDTVGTIMSISVLLIPIIAIMLGYSTIAGEAENGSLYVVLSYPVKRSEVLLGKFIGLGSVIVVSCIVGFGAGGLIIAATVGTASGMGFLAFIALTILTGLLYLALTIMASAYCKRKVTALAAGILIFFWAMIYGMIIMGIYLATGGSMSDFFSGNLEFPDWLWRSIFLSPGDMYQMSSMQAFGVNQMFGFSITPPEYLSLQILVGAQLLWTIVPLVLAYFFLKRRDI